MDAVSLGSARALSGQDAGPAASSRPGICGAGAQAATAGGRASRSLLRDDPAAGDGALYGGAACAGCRCRRTRRACDEALDLLAPFHAELLPLCPSLAPLWTHNDLHASNLFWSDASEHAQATAIIDFGLATAPTRCTIWRTPSSATLWSGWRWCNDPSHPDDVPVHLRSSAGAAGWLRAGAAALSGRSRWRWRR